ncbi:MAG: hypothetical protein JRJ65_04195 [Deltaproteobacteria bacterium]|nr:hypothetical protein [Deltaproteobacteria bacterium]
MMSLSSLIKGEEKPLFSIKSFKPEEIGKDRQDGSSLNNNSHVKLPLSKASSVFPHLRKRENTKDKLARLEKEAYEKGFAQGQKDGLALEKKQMEEKGSRFEALFSELNSLKARIHSETEEELLKLSMLIAKRITREEVKTDIHIIGRTIRSALKFVVEKSNIRILINHDDMEAVRELLPDLAAVNKGAEFQLVEDNAIERGGCILETGFGKINATIDDQLVMLEKEVDREFSSHQGEFHGALS